MDKKLRYTQGDTILGRYLITDIHMGSMAVTYRAQDKLAKCNRALKTLKPRFQHIEEMQELFVQQASAWTCIERHPNIAQAFLVDFFDEQPFVISQYIRGPEKMGNDLRYWLGKSELTVPLAARIALEVSQAMLHATQDRPGLVHRDLKPANILIDEQQHAFVTDFGLVYAKDSRSGTPAYMAPEQWRREPVSEQSDIYAFGLICYEMLTSHRVFKAYTIEEWEKVHLHTTPLAPRELNDTIPEAVEDFILHCIEKDPSARPGSWQEVVAACIRWGSM